MLFFLPLHYINGAPSHTKSLLVIYDTPPLPLPKCSLFLICKYGSPTLVGSVVMLLMIFSSALCEILSIPFLLTIPSRSIIKLSSNDLYLVDIQPESVVQYYFHKYMLITIVMDGEVLS